MPLGSLSVRYDCSDPSSLFQASGGTGAVSAANDPVGRISDLSGNGRHATASGSARPTYQPGTLNGLAIARGNGINDVGLMTVMDVPVAAMPDGPCTITAVVIPRGFRSVGNNRIFHTRSASGGHVNFGIRCRRDLVLEDYGWLQVVVGSTASATTLALNSYGTCVLPINRPAIITVIAGDTSHGPRLRKDDGPAVGTEDPYVADFNFTWASLFARKESGDPQEPGQFDLCEFMIRSGVPESTEEYLSTVWSPLREKWDTPKKPTRTYLQWATAGFDAIADRIGQVGDPGHSIPSCIIERVTGGMTDGRFRPHPWTREGDRPLGGNAGGATEMWDGATPVNKPCHNYDRALGWYRLGLALGGSRANVVRAALDELIGHTLDTPRGLITGGEHLTLSLVEPSTNAGYGGQPTNSAQTGGNHLAFEKFAGRRSWSYLLDRPEGIDAIIATANGAWEHGLIGKGAPGSLDGNRHVPAVTGTQSVQGNLYPRVLGQYLYLNTLAYQHTSDSTYRDRAEFLLNHLLLTGTSPGTSPNFVRRHTTTRAINFSNGGSLVEGIERNLLTPMLQLAAMANYLDEALALGALPSGVADKAIEIRDEADQVLLAFPHDLGLGGDGIVTRVMWNDLSVRVGPYAGRFAGDHMPDEAFWAWKYVMRRDAATARGDTSLAAQFHAIGKAVADRYINFGPPAPGETGMPMGYAAAIKLLLSVHQVEGGTAYLEGAQVIADRLIEEIFDADSDIPRSDAESAYYETTAGNTEGLFALHELATALEAPEAIAPGTLSAGTPTSTAVTLSWTDATGGEGVISAQLEWRLAGEGEWAEIWEATSSPVTDDELEAGLSYEYRVRFEDEADQVAYSNVVAVTAPEEPDPDPIVAGTLSAGTPTATSVTLTWTAATGGEGALSTQLERAIAGAWAEVSGATASPHPDPGLQPETTYQYRVRWTGSADQLAYSNVVEVTTPALPAEGFQPGGMPTLVVRTALSATIAWDGPTGGIGPVVEQLQIRVGDGPWQDVPGATSSPATIPGLSPATGYVARVRQTDLEGE